MFRKLRIKFTLSTLLILSIFLSVLSSTLYFGTKGLITSNSKNILEKSANEIIYENFRGLSYFGLPDFQDDFSMDERIKDRFNLNDTKLKLSYAIYDQGLNLIYVNNNSEIPFNDFEKYVLLSYQDKNNSFINNSINGIDYRIYTVFFNKANKVGVVQLYQDITMETFILKHLILALAILSLISLFVLTLISWYLAGRSIKPVKSSWERQKEFVADASHELRTPLTVIQTNLEAALYDKNSTIEENEMWLNNVYSETELMTKLVEELLMLAKIDANQIALNREKINFSKICNNTIDKFMKKIDEKNIELITNIDENLYVLGDELRFSQLATIFIDNAIKYTQAKGKIVINLSKEKNVIVFKIKDSGIGISGNDIDRIFDRFYRADKARHREDGGTGLGLSIAKWIVDVYKGKIKVESILNKGTTFTIELPINL